MNALAEMRSAQHSPADFGERMRGAGPRWKNASDLFELHHRRLGFLQRSAEELDALRPPGRPRQGTLFS
jgi:hypothetical protein